MLDTDKGLVLVSGCGHAGIINTLEYARKQVRETRVHAAPGGLPPLRGRHGHPGLDRGEAAPDGGGQPARRPLHGDRAGVSAPTTARPEPRHLRRRGCRCPVQPPVRARSRRNCAMKDLKLEQR